MARFEKITSLENLEQKFLEESNGADMLEGFQYPGNVRYSDIRENEEIVERLMSTEYNTISGMTFSDYMNAISHIKSQTPRQYMADNRMKKGLCENFYGTTQAQQQFPVLNKGLVLYHYEGSVVPYISHMFDLKGNRGLAYYMDLVATNTVGDVTTGDLIASPKKLAKQTKNFIGTKMIEVPVEITVATQASYSFVIPNFPILPQSLTIRIDSVAGFFQDVSTNVSGVTNLLSVNNNIGTCTVDLNSGLTTLVFAVAPAVSGLQIFATYNRDVQTTDGGVNNQARVAPVLESIQLQAEDFSVFTETILHQQRLAQIIWGQDWNELVDSLLGMVYNREIANKITADIQSKIPAPSIMTYNIAPIPNSGDNKLFDTAFFATVLNRLNVAISKASGITGLASLTTYIVNQDLLPVLRYNPKFKSIDAGENFMSGMAIVGTLDGTPVIAAYEPIVASGEILGIYKSKQQPFLTPAVFGTFILPIIRDVYDQNNLAINRKQLIASAAEEVVVPSLSAKITVNGLADIGLA